LVTDRLPFNRRTRAFSAVVAVLVMNLLIWGAGIGFQVKFTRADKIVMNNPIPWDWTVGAAVGPIILLMAC
jgi:hypothetical protein